MKIKHIAPNNIPLRVLFSILFSLFLGVDDAKSQTELLCGVLQKRIPDTVAYSDRFGNLYSEEELSIWGLNIQQNHCGQIEDFELIFENVNGLFPFSTDEMETICDVFDYLSELIDAPSGERAIVRLSKSPDLGTGVGALGTGFSSPQCGLGYNVVQQQLITGGITTSQHALIQINANISDFYIGPAGGIGANEFDYYTVVLHEALHTLGFGSRITPSGAASQGFYSLWDLNLINPAGDYMILVEMEEEGACCAEYEFNDDDFPNMPDIIWNQDCGLTNVQFDVVLLPPVNAEYGPGQLDPSTFMNVLSHLDRDCPGSEHYVMNPGVPSGADGVQRTLTASEVSILCKLGYELNDCEPDCIVIAADDGNYFVGLNESITLNITTLLSNDFPTNATFSIRPDCGNTNGLDITVSPTAIDIIGITIGSYSFCYTITSCDGRRCDVGNVRVIVTNPDIDDACQDLVPCQINPFWDFEGFGSSDEMYPLLTLGDGNGMGDGVSGTGFAFYEGPWVIDNTPDLWENPIFLNNQRTCGAGNLGGINTPFGSQCLGMIIRNINGVNLSEGAAFPLCEPIFPGMSATIRFNAMTPENCTGVGTPQVQARLEFSELPPVDEVLVYDNPGMSSGQPILIDITSTQNTNPIFGEYTINITNASSVCWNFLYLSGVSVNPTVPPDYGYLLVDNVTVFLENDLSDLIDIESGATPENPCIGDIVTIEVEFCNDLACLPNVYSNPEFTLTGMLPTGLFHVPNGDFPTLSYLVQAGEIPFGGCLTLEMTAMVGNDPGLVSQNLPITFGLEFAPELCYENIQIPGGVVSPILCVNEEFSCPCGPNGINIDASVSNPLFDAALGGVPYSALEAAFNYDANDDGIIGATEHNNCIAILGRLIIDQNIGIASCSNIQMQPCSEIVVGTNTLHPTFEVTNNTIFSCDVMWRGITVNPHATMNFKGNTLRDAQFGISAIGGSGIGVTPPTRMVANGNSFTNNHVGVIFPGNMFTTVTHLPFTSNLFNTTATLLPPCDAGLPNYSANQGGYAGVVTLGTPITIGRPFGSVFFNTFRFLRNGVISENSVLNVYRADFQSITAGNNGDIQSFASASGNGIAANRGIVTVFNCNFNTVFTGLSGHDNQQISFTNNTLDHMWRGVDIRGAHSSDISDNPSIGFTNRGVISREVISAGGFNRHRIANNTNMFPSSFPGATDSPFPPFRAAIEVENAMSADIGNGTITNNHFSTAFAADGIRINGSGGWDIDQNSIDFLNPASPNFSNSGTGVQITNSHSNYLYQNTINDFDQTFRLTTGFSLSIGSGNRYCCNSTFGNRIGSRFLGACNATEWRVTNMNLHQFALFCDDGTVIDLQFDYGDRFNATSGTAFHGGGDFDIINSRFRVLNMLQPHWPVAIATPNATVTWFDDDGTSSSCTAPCVAPEYAPLSPDGQIRDSDIETAGGTWTGSNYGEALQWESGRRLYERMHDFVGMLGANTSTDTFYYTASSAKIGAYYEAEQRAKSLYKFPTYLEDEQYMALSAVESNRLGVDSILSGLASATTHGDSTTIINNANTLHASLTHQAADLTHFSAQTQSIRNAQAMNALILTNPLVTASAVEQNRKKVQQIYLQTVGLGIKQLTPLQLSIVEPIALQCPLEGGSAVYAARALYRLQIERSFVDDSLCIPTQAREQITTRAASNADIFLYPNPANESVTLKGLVLSGDKPARIQFMDANGLLYLEQSIAEREQTFSVATFPSGVYFCRIQQENALPVILKLVISH